MNNFEKLKAAVAVGSKAVALVLKDNCPPMYHYNHRIKKMVEEGFAGGEENAELVLRMVKAEERANDFVDNEVLVRQTMTIGVIMWSNDYDMVSECSNMFRNLCPECGESDPIVDEKDDEKLKCNHCSAEFSTHDCETEVKEVYEWYAVSDFLGNELEARGEVVWDGPDCKVWGRCTTGQHIVLDGIMQQIAFDVLGR